MTVDVGTWTVPRPLLRLNDHGTLEPPSPEEWTPRLDVSVVIPAHGGQERLDLTLASLTAQTYPSSLTQVVVVDDGSEPPLRLPDLRPENTVLVPSGPGGWGPGHAVRSGIAVADGAVLLRLDADMVAFRDHVESQMRWHHLADYVVVVGGLRFVEHGPGGPGPEEVAAAVREGTAQGLFGDGEEMEWLVESYRRTGRLRRAGHTAYRNFIGATNSMGRDLYRRSGGSDPELVLGEDTHLAYRLAQQGAVFLPDPDSGSLHLGLPQMQRRREEGFRYRAPFVGNRLPLTADRERITGRGWQVPMVDVVMEVGDVPSALVADTVDRLLGGTTTDLRITLVADRPWEGSGDGLPALRAYLESDPRTRFRTSPPEPDLDVPFVLWTRPGFAFAPDAVGEMLRQARLTKAGLVRAAMPRGGPEGPRLERLSSFARARHLAEGDADVDRLVDEVAGVRWMDGTSLLDPEEGVEEPEEREGAEEWRTRLEETEREAASWRSCADRWKRRHRWLTGTGTGRRVLRALG